MWPGACSEATVGRTRGEHHLGVGPRSDRADAADVVGVDVCVDRVRECRIEGRRVRNVPIGSRAEWIHDRRLVAVDDEVAETPTRGALVLLNRRRPVGRHLGGDEQIRPRVHPAG